jgi:hypothetical protein
MLETAATKNTHAESEKIDAKVYQKKFAVKENITIKNKPAKSKKITVEFIPYKQVKKIAVECSSREPRLRRLTPGTTTLNTPLNILKTNCSKMLIVQTHVHQLTVNSPITNTPRNTIKKPRPAFNAHEDLPTIATAPLDQVETHKMEFAMFNTEGDIAKE